ncbi:MAG: aspartate aminotransferase family protein [Actinomycetota bacterium]|nr:aspartate aminotransferase family protein [Actinomycetota bacterium]
MRTYKRAPVDFVRGEGPLLWDADGKEYLDFLTGISVCSLGHCHPAVVEAVREQAGRLMHVSNLFYTEPMARLAQRLSESSLGGRVFFSNSGTEAVECAIKVARKHAHERGIAEPEIVSFQRDFHGRSYGALAATPSLAANEALGPMLPGFRAVPHNDAAALREAVGERTAAVLVEPIQGEAGVWPTSDEALLAARQACDEAGALLILDEIQTGVGRTGKLFAYEWTGIAPDIMSVAKGIGGGFPLGACLATAEAAKGMTVGSHGTTFGGNPLAMAVGNAVLDVVLAPGFLEHVRQMGLLLKQRLAELKDRHPAVIAEIRGQGLLLGLRLNVPIADFVDAALRQKLLTIAAGENVARLLPPLIVEEGDIREAVDRIDAACEALEKDMRALTQRGAA